jgi:hypothetical protein
MAEENKIILDADVKPLKKQLREATLELQNARREYGEFSDEAVRAAQNVAGIRDEIDAANESAQLFDPGKRFQALTTAASTAAGGIAAAQGAMALFGGESEEVEKALLKVQSAMALSQGLSQLKDISKVGEQLKISFKGLTVGVNGFKKALIATGIGALVVAVGLLVTYWEDILGLVNGVGSEQKKLNKDAEENLKVQQEKLDAIDGQSNQLKLQGLSEKEILELKIAQTEEAIKAAEVNIANAKATKKAQVEASQRNRDILQGVIKAVSAPLTMILSTIDAAGKALGKNFGLVEGFSGGLAELVFDPAETAAAGDATIKEAEATLNTLKEKQAGFLLSQQDSQKAAGEKASAEREKQNQKELEAQAILDEIKNKNLDKQKQEELAINKAYDEKQKKIKEAGIVDDGTIEKARQDELKAISDKYKKEEADQEADFQKQLNEIRTQTRLAGIKDENEKARQQILLDYEKQREEVLTNEKLTADQKKILTLELATQEKQALDALQLSIDEADAIKDLEAIDKEIARADQSFLIQKQLMDSKQMMLDEQFKNGIISEQNYNAQNEELTNARILLAEKEAAVKTQLLQMIGQSLGQAADIVGKDTKAGKALGVASAAINTYQGIAAGVKLGFPLAIPAVAMAAATGFGAIKNIMAVKVPGGGGGPSAPSVNMSAPSTMPAVPTIGTSPVTALGTMMQNQPPLRAFVVESEVTNSQKRVADIERRAGF